MKKKSPTVLARVLVAILVFTIVSGLVVLFTPPEEQKELADSRMHLHLALCTLWQTITTPNPVNVFLVLLFGIVGIGMAIVCLWLLRKGRETKKERIRVVPMLSRIDQGEYGEICVVIPASQMRDESGRSLTPLTLHLGDYGEIIIAGGGPAIAKIKEVLIALNFKVEFENSNGIACESLP